MDRIWKYEENQFLRSTRHSHVRVLKLSTYHKAMLRKMLIEEPAEPLWTLLHDRYMPLHQAVEDAYTKWRGAQGTQKGDTYGVRQLLALMTGKLNVWQPQVEVVYACTTPTFITLFPQGRKAFTRANFDDRIAAVGALAKALLDYPALVAVQADVAAFHTLLKTARSGQNGAKGMRANRSNGMRKARFNAMTMQYRNLGLLMDHYWDRPGMMGHFFDLVTLRDKQQRLFTATLDPGEVHPLLVHTFLPDEQMEMHVVGNEGPATFFLASYAGGADSTPVTIAANEKRTVAASDFGDADLGTHRYLTAIGQGQGAVKVRVKLEA
jgi:hypothetical protein